MSDNNEQSLGLGVGPTGYDKDEHKPTLCTLPEELIEKIMLNLHPFPFACLGITARKFYRIHWKLKGIVRIGVHDYFYEETTLSMLLNTWMKERGLVWVVEAQKQYRYSVEYSQWRIYVHHFPGVFVTSEWLKSPGQEVRKDPIALDGDEPIYIDQVGMYPKIDGKVEKGEDMEA